MGLTRQILEKIEELELKPSAELGKGLTFDQVEKLLNSMGWAVDPEDPADTDTAVPMTAAPELEGTTRWWFRHPKLGEKNAVWVYRKSAQGDKVVRVSLAISLGPGNKGYVFEPVKILTLKEIGKAVGDFLAQESKYAKAGAKKAGKPEGLAPKLAYLVGAKLISAGPAELKAEGKVDVRMPDVELKYPILGSKAVLTKLAKWMNSNVYYAQFVMAKGDLEPGLTTVTMTPFAWDPPEDPDLWKFWDDVASTAEELLKIVNEGSAGAAKKKTPAGLDPQFLQAIQGAGWLFTKIGTYPNGRGFSEWEKSGWTLKVREGEGQGQHLFMLYSPGPVFHSSKVVDVNSDPNDLYSFLHVPDQGPAAKKAGKPATASPYQTLEEKLEANGWSKDDEGYWTEGNDYSDPDEDQDGLYWERWTKEGDDHVVEMTWEHESVNPAQEITVALKDKNMKVVWDKKGPSAAWLDGLLHNLGGTK